MMLLASGILTDTMSSTSSISGMPASLKSEMEVNNEATHTWDNTPHTPHIPPHIHTPHTPHIHTLHTYTLTHHSTHTLTHTPHTPHIHTSHTPHIHATYTPHTPHTHTHSTHANLLSSIECYLKVPPRIIGCEVVIGNLIGQE